MRVYKLYLLGLLVFGSSIISAQGVKVLAPLTINSPSDKYATHFDSLGSGGYVTVANINSRNNISTLRRKIGMLVYAADVDSVYQLIGGVANSNWRGFKFNTGASCITWQGSLALAPVSPQLNWAYYNTTDKKSYLYDGSSWTILAQDGNNGVGIIWQGSLATAPASPVLNWAYYNTTDKKSYFFDGVSWLILAQDGSTGSTGLNGISITWKGTFTTAPLSPQLNWAYYNSTDKKSYLFDGSSWSILAQDGADGTNGINGTNGTNGIGFTWKGTLTVAPSSPQLNWSYYNSIDKKSYVYDGTSWTTLVQDGVNGAGIVWKGNLATAPTGAQVNWAYYNTADKRSYLYDGATWQMLAQDGANGISLNWQGELAIAPSSPQQNWAYYNSTDKKSYIYDGFAWQVLAQDGTPILWQGSWDVDPDNPQTNWAYYNYIDGASYIFDGTSWQELTYDGATGADGIGITWKGSLSVAPSSAQLNWAYYNTNTKASYIYDGTTWNILAKDGLDGQLKAKDGLLYEFTYQSIDINDATIAANEVYDTTFAANIPSSIIGYFVGATVTVSPSSDLPVGIVIPWARVLGYTYSYPTSWGGTGTRNVRFRLYNPTTASIVVPPTRFFVSIIYSWYVPSVE